MSTAEYLRTGRVKLIATAVMALLFTLVLATMAQPTEASTCANCDPGGGSGDTIAPTVTSVSPANGVSDVLPAANATVTFSEEMDLTSITSSTFTLVRQGQTTPVAAAVSYDSATSTATLNPDADLAQKASYTATVKGGAGGVTDLAGNPLAADYTWSFTVPDKTPPTVALTSPAKDAHVRGTVQISATASDNVGMSHVALRVQGGAWSEYDYSAPYGMIWDSTQYRDGSVSLQAIAYDTSLNWADHSYNFIVDNTVPVVTITSGPSGMVNSSSATFEFLATDANMGTVECRLDNLDWQTCASSRTYTGLTDAEHTLEVRATDKAGNTDTEVRNWTVDTTDPTGSVKINGGAAYTRSATVNLSLSASDPSPGSGVTSMRFSNDGANWSGWESFATSKSWTLAGGNGTRTAYVQYRDKAGNVSTSALDRIVLDTIKPTISGMSPRHASTTRDTTPTIKATVKDNLTNLQKANIKLYVNGVLISPTKWSYSAATDALLYNSPRLAKGKKTVKIVATDAARNVGTKSWYFTIR